MDQLTVVTTLENCIGNGPCTGCHFDVSIPGYTNFPDCMVELQREALKIIQRLTENTVFKETFCDGLPFKDEVYDTSYTCVKCGANSIGKSNYCKSCGRPVAAILETDIINDVEVNA